MTNKKKIKRRESKCVKENRKRNGRGHLQMKKQAKTTNKEKECNTITEIKIHF